MKHCNRLNAEHIGHQQAWRRIRLFIITRNENLHQDKLNTKVALEFSIFDHLPVCSQRNSIHETSFEDTRAT